MSETPNPEESSELTPKIPPPTPADRERDLAADYYQVTSRYLHPGSLQDLATAALRLLAEARRERDALKAEVARLREALQPLARAAEETSAGWDQSCLRSAFGNDRITVGDCRRARAALGKDGGT